MPRWKLWAIFLILSSYSTAYKVGVSNNDTDIIEYVLLNQDAHPCARECTNGEPPMICRYHFSLEWYHTLTKACYDCPSNLEDCFRPHCIPGDGNKRAVVVVNRQMPGPSVEVCLGDEVVVDVENLLQSDSTTIHWHGHQQIGTPYMDGVPFVTQCPILPGTTFRYKFKAVHAGTHFWHSHSGMQRADGVFGSFVVRLPEELDPHAMLYDYDLFSHKMIILDWTPEIGISKFTYHHHSEGDNKPSTILVNGHGRFVKFNDALARNQTFTPIERFRVEKGYRYRFRVINAGYLNCPIEISIDNHTLTVISSDGFDFQPVVAESIVTYAGERFDFIINADQSANVYWMRFRGLMDCDARFKSAHQVAILQYSGISDDQYPDGDPDYEQSHKPGLQINALNTGSSDNATISIPELAVFPDDNEDVALKETPDIKYFVSYDFYKKDNPHYHYPNLYGFYNVTDQKKRLLTPQLNYISMKLLPFPLLPQRDAITQDMFCNETTVQNCDVDYCECTHVVQIPLGTVVEMILIDKGFAFDANHPFHLHGHSFRVIAMEKLGKNVTLQEVEDLDAKGKIERNLIDPPHKDTITVPDGGYTILRIHANNPGYWIFHCHIEFHVEVGMALVFKIGEHSEMERVPTDFPKCGNWIPTSSADLEDCGDKSVFTFKHWFPNIFNKNCNESKSSHQMKITSIPQLVILSFILLCT